jgi:hypothetical protein
MMAQDQVVWRYESVDLRIGSVVFIAIILISSGALALGQGFFDGLFTAMLLNLCGVI